MPFRPGDKLPSEKMRTKTTEPKEATPKNERKTTKAASAQMIAFAIAFLKIKRTAMRETSRNNRTTRIHHVVPSQGEQVPEKAK